jgi:opacity protein-like surface antigen
MPNRLSLARLRRGLVLAALLTLLAPTIASAQIHQVSSSSSDARQTINFNVGYFALKGLDSRPVDDVLFNELQSAQPLLFEVKDFNYVTFGGEYLIGFGGAFEAGVGLNYYQHTVPSVYANLQHSNGSEIEQDLKLRTIPVTFTARFLPLRRGSVVEPYIGAGLVAIRWDYSEVGEFVDAVDDSIFPARFTADGTAVGPTVVAGLRAPISNFTFGGEVRWQKAEGDIPADAGFLGTKIDLGGWITNFTLGIRF